MIVLKTPKGWTGPEGRRRPAGRGNVPGAPGAALRADRAPRAPEDARGLDAELPARGALRRERPAHPRAARAGSRRASAGWEPTRTPTAASCSATCGCPTSAITRSTCPQPGNVMDEDTRTLGKFLRDVIKLNAGPAQLPDLRPGRDGLQPPDRRLRGDRTSSGTPRSSPTDDHLAADGPRDRDAQRAPVRGLARRLPAHRPPRPLQHLRGVRPHHRLDVQPARQVAEGHPAHPLAAADRLAQHPAGVARLAAGPQRLHPSGSRLHRPRVSTRRPRSSASTCRPTPTRCSR